MAYSIEFSAEFEKSIKKMKKKDKAAFEQIQKKAALWKFCSYLHDRRQYH